jgi:predicted ATPase
MLEELYRDQAGEMAVQLVRHFEEAGLTEKAIHYLCQAGERAVQLSAYQEGIAHLTRGLALLMSQPDSLERAQQELALQLSLITAWIGPKSYISPEVEGACTRARELCRQIGKTSQLSRVLGQLSIFHYVRAEYHKARELAEEALSLAQGAEEPLLVALGHWYLGCIQFGLGESTTARAHLDQVISVYEPQQHHHPFVGLQGADAGVSALAYDACCLWCLGYPDQALSRSQEAFALARGLGHPFSLADVLSYAGCMFHSMRRDAQALKDNAEELMQLSKERGLVGWLTFGTRYWGEALALLGQVRDGITQMREGVAGNRSMLFRLYLLGTLGYLAEAQGKVGRPEEGLTTLDEALALVVETGERVWEAELCRLRAELLLMQGDEVKAEASLHKAIEVARRQQAKSWELRATTSLSRLWQSRGRGAEAHRMLAEIYDWFTEGFDTPDLREARGLLEELSQSAW